MNMNMKDRLKSYNYAKKEKYLCWPTSRNAQRRCIGILPYILLALILFFQIHFYKTYMRGQNRIMDVGVVETLSSSHVFASGVFSNNPLPTIGFDTFSPQPRVVRLVDGDTLTSDAADILYIPPSKGLHEMKEMQIQVSERGHQYASTFVHGDCVQMKDWQLTSFPSCNSIHEYLLAETYNKQARLINHGQWRDVWKIDDMKNNNYALKTMRYVHDYSERNYDRHRRDSVAMERLSGSPYIVDTYGFCGNSGIFQFGKGGDLNSFIWGRRSRNFTLTDALHIAKDVAAGVAALHTFDGNYATIAHTDIKPAQFISIDGKFRLNDFNRCRFIAWNKKKKKPCIYQVGNNPGKIRSPEEYIIPHIQTEKVDVFSMCNIFYSLLTKERPWDSFKNEIAKERIKKGHRPHIDEDLKNSDNPIIKVFLIAMDKCYITNPKERARASEILNFFNVALVNIADPNYIPKWKR